MAISQKGVDFIASFEGFRANPYLDSVGVPTIGYGTIRYPNGTRVTLKDKPITKEKALEYLKQHVEEHIQFCLSVPMTQAQLDAIYSFAYNLGVGAFNSSTLKKKIEKEAPDKEIEAEFLRWNKAGGKVLAGLTRRRQAEANLFLTGKYFNN